MERVNKKMSSQSSLFVDIWVSFRALPLWVQIWVVLILAPVNFVSLLFLNEPMGKWIAFLATSGILVNLPILVQSRGFSKAMGIPHVIFWTTLVFLLIFSRPSVTGTYNTYLWVLLITNLISLGFDYMDSWQWLRGNRTVIGR